MDRRDEISSGTRRGCLESADSEGLPRGDEPAAGASRVRDAGPGGHGSPGPGYVRLIEHVARERVSARAAVRAQGGCVAAEERAWPEQWLRELSS